MVGIDIKAPWFSIALICFFCISYAITQGNYYIIDYVVLGRWHIDYPSQWYRFFTYPLFNPDLFTFGMSSLWLFMAGILLESKFGKKLIIKITLGSIFLGGFIFVISSGESSSERLASIFLMTLGLMSFAAVFVIREWNRIRVFEKVIGVLFILILLFGLLPADSPHFKAQVSVIFIIGSYSYLRLRLSKALVKEDDSSTIVN